MYIWSAREQGGRYVYSELSRTKGCSVVDGAMYIFCSFVVDMTHDSDVLPIVRSIFNNKTIGDMGSHTLNCTFALYGLYTDRFARGMSLNKQPGLQL